MNRNKKITILIGCFFVCLVWFWNQHKDINTVLRRIDYPFEVGEVVCIEEIEKNTTMVIYTNKRDIHKLQNVIIRKKGLFYNDIYLSGSLKILQPTELKSGSRRTGMLVFWYDKSDKYILMCVSYDKDVKTIKHKDQILISTQFKGYNIFWGLGNGRYEDYKLYDKEENELESIKP
ncbi:MAG: hypothetical protein E7231_12595 [Cellulosilyticum sp.]|nr:hypothetical protein [Cellulosilyticum sp.]